MNQERMLRLADHLDAIPKDQFDMCHFCGTACCLAGHAVILFVGRNPANMHSDEVSEVAKGLLELNGVQMDALFYAVEGPMGEHPLEDITPSMAAEALRQVVREGYGEKALVVLP